ncbi:MAG: TIGR02757 family protein [Bacteroidales bacterium]|nr:TIGR02757 family protein [Bacteroidales bacterium]MDD3011534.1 TIGR02757 family protein [Bacteroidales bacterium]MDD3961333.1 TIGR02757 family protein [Bacteroidales bacterium]HPE86717.1 TIGR02757 family protein [Bacteroidales bacterium]
MQISPSAIAVLDKAYTVYATRAFILNDPVAVAHQFSRKEDIEISAFLTAIIAWGNRVSIQNSAKKMLQLMDYTPYHYVSAGDFRNLTQQTFAHRTFNRDDFHFFVSALHTIYGQHGGLEGIFATAYRSSGSVMESINHFREVFLETPHLRSSERHLAHPASGSAAKRINMFLRWMVRTDREGIDFNLWKGIPSSALICPLDIHSGRSARSLGLLTRKTNDRKSAEELTAALRRLDPEDPVKYDFALFSLSERHYSF